MFFSKRAFNALSSSSRCCGDNCILLLAMFFILLLQAHRASRGYLPTTAKYEPVNGRTSTNASRRRITRCPIGVFRSGPIPQWPPAPTPDLPCDEHARSPQGFPRSHTSGLCVCDIDLVNSLFVHMHN